MGDKQEKPSLPDGYKVPAVWTFKEQEGIHRVMNRPTAGARHEKALPVGKHPIQLYSLGTPNGQKVTILLEELGVEYDAWKINLLELEQFGSGFVEVNPNSKIPAMVDNTFDPPLRVFESGHILKYLAEKYDRFIPKDPRKKTECFNWLFWQMASAPLIGGGFGHFFHYAPVSIEYAIDRFTMETKRQLDVLDRLLAERDYVAGDEYTIADMAIFPWMRSLRGGFNADKFLSLDDYKHVNRWLAAISARDAVKRGLRVNGFGEGAVPERHSSDDLLPPPP